MSYRVVRGIVSFALALLLSATAAWSADSFSSQANPNPDKAGAAAAPVPPRAAPLTSLGTVTVYPTRAAFQLAFPGLPMETFEDGNAPGGGFSVCDSPLDDTGDAPCGFAAGEILSGVAFQDNPGPEPASLILLGAGASLNPSMALIANTFADSFDVVFDPPVTAAGMDLHSTPALGQGPPDVINWQVFDSGNVLVDSGSTAGSGPGDFWGFSSATPIGRINLFSTNNRAEGVDNIEFAGEPALIASAITDVDSCASDPGNNNGIWEPGESINITVELTASAGGFTGISGTLTTGTAGVTIVSGASTWPDLASGASANGNTAFVIEIDDTIACGTSVDLTLTVTANEGGPFPIQISELIGQPLAPDVPLAIPDSPAPAVESDLVVADPVILTDVDVRVQIDHTWVGDLLIRLRAPDNSEVVLLDRPGVPMSGAGCSDNNMDVTFDDASGFDPELHCAATDPWFVGLANPVGSLAAFNGLSAAGTWTLLVSDHAGADVGTIVDWELITVPPISGVCTVCVPIVIPQADLGMSKTSDAAGTVVPGDPVVFTLTVQNNGPAGATNVVVTDTLPSAFDYVSNDCGAGFADPTLTWNVGALAAAASATCNVSVVVAADAPVGAALNTATVTATEGDPGPTANSAEVSVEIGEGGGGPSILEIPTLDRAGLALLLAGLAAAALLVLRRR